MPDTRLHELRSNTDVIVINSSGSIRVLTPEGAVFNSLCTDDLRELSVASANLFEDDWRHARLREINEWVVKAQERVLRLEVAVPVKD